MKISVIICTFNRADSLRETLRSIVALVTEASFEVLVVDNDSSDRTRQVVDEFVSHYPKLVRYLFEPCRALSKARNTGARFATGDVIMLVDDDVQVQPGSMRQIVALFARYPECGMIAAQVVPKYIEPPPPWCWKCEKTYNGWALYYPGNQPFLAKGFQEVGWAPGAMQITRRTAFETVGGYPPDLIALEPTKGSGKFLTPTYGPGDSGLAWNVRKAGYKIYYSPDVVGLHVISPARFTVKFWRTRMRLEGHYHAISSRACEEFTNTHALLERKRKQIHYLKNKSKVEWLFCRDGAKNESDGMMAEEIWIQHDIGYLEMDLLLRKHPALWKFFWQLGLEGVAATEFDNVRDQLPIDYKNILIALLEEEPPINSVGCFGKLTAQLSPSLQLELEQTSNIMMSFNKFLALDGQSDDLFNIFLKQEYSATAARLLTILIPMVSEKREIYKWIAALHVEAGQDQMAQMYLARATAESPVDDELLAVSDQMNLRVCTPCLPSSPPVNPASVEGIQHRLEDEFRAHVKENLSRNSRLRLKTYVPWRLKHIGHEILSYIGFE